MQMKETNNFKSSAKACVGYSEFTTLFRIQHKEWDTDFVPNHHVWIDILGSWSKVCIKALELRMDACVSMLFRNRNNVVKANEDQIVFKKKNSLLHSFNHQSFQAMERMVDDLQKGNWKCVKENYIGCFQLLKALYWIPEEDRKDCGGFGFGELISLIFELTTARES